MLAVRGGAFVTLECRRRAARGRVQRPRRCQARQSMLIISYKSGRVGAVRACEVKAAIVLAQCRLITAKAFLIQPRKKHGKKE